MVNEYVGGLLEETTTPATTAPMITATAPAPTPITHGFLYQSLGAAAAASRARLSSAARTSASVIRGLGVAPRSASVAAAMATSSFVNGPSRALAWSYSAASSGRTSTTK